MPKPLLFLLRPVRACVSSRVRQFVTPWTVAHQALLSMEFSRQEFWSGSYCRESSQPRDQTGVS